MGELKTKPSKKSVAAFLDAIEHDRQREDCKRLAAIMTEVTKQEPVIWGKRMIGYGSYRYRYASGQSGEWFLTGFAPRGKRNLTVYAMAGLGGAQDLLAKLGTYTSGRGCIYLNSLDDVHVPTLKKLIARSVAETKKLSAR